MEERQKQDIQKKYDAYEIVDYSKKNDSNGGSVNLRYIHLFHSIH